MQSVAGRCLAVALAASVVGCESPQDPDPVPGDAGWRDSQVVAVQEAVHRAQFAEHAPGAQPGTVTFCLAQTGPEDETPWTDPPDALLRLFASHTPVVKKFSLCVLDLRGDRDPATGTPAVIFRVGPPKWQSDTEVVLDGGHHQNGLNASGQTYRVRYQNGRWVVVETTWRWIA